MVAAAAEGGGERRGARGGGTQALVVSLALAASTAPGAGDMELAVAKGGSDCRWGSPCRRLWLGDRSRHGAVGGEQPW